MTALLLEPVPLRAICEAIRDERWIDLRVADVGTVQRVLITQLNVGREGERVVVKQKFLEAEEVVTAQHDFDAEDLIWLRETAIAMEDVKPISRQQRAPDAVIANDLATHVIDTIIRTMTFLSQGVTEPGIRKGLPVGSGYGALRPRQEAMWLAYEMTDLHPSEICTKHFGYKSQQPLLTIHDKIHWAIANGRPIHYNEKPNAWLNRVRAAAKLIDSTLGQTLRRATTASPHWTTIL